MNIAAIAQPHRTGRQARPLADAFEEWASTVGTLAVVLERASSLLDPDNGGDVDQGRRRVEALREHIRRLTPQAEALADRLTAFSYNTARGVLVDSDGNISEV